MASIHEIVGPDGRKPRLGRYEKTLMEASYLGSAIGSVNIVGSATGAAPTVSYGSIATTHGYVQAATDAVAGAEATITTTDGWAPANWSILWAEWEAVRLDGASYFTGSPEVSRAAFACGFRGASTLFGLYQTGLDDTAVIQRQGSASVPTNFDILRGSGRGTKHHRIRMGIDLGRKQGLWQVGDSELQAVDLPGVVNQNNTRPRLLLATQEAASHWIRCSRFRVWGEYS